MHAALTVVVWDHLITFCDEVQYVWKKEKSWGTFHQILSQNEILTDRVAFCLFIVVRFRRVVGFRVVTKYLTEQVLCPALQDLAHDQCGAFPHRVREWRIHRYVHSVILAWLYPRSEGFPFLSSLDAV